MVTKISRYKITATTDSSGDATAYSKAVRGKIVAIYVDYGASVAATADLTITDEETGTQIYTNTNTNSDLWAYPRTPAQDNAGADVTYDGTNEIYTKFVVFSRVKAVVAQGGDTKIVTMYVYVEEY